MADTTGAAAWREERTGNWGWKRYWTRYQYDLGIKRC